jgi:hypothetical protein
MSFDLGVHALDQVATLLHLVKRVLHQHSFTDKLVAPHSLSDVVGA